MSRRGSWPVLIALSATALLLFWWQRSRSAFLRIESERPAAVALAEQWELPLADVFALRDLVAVDASPARWREAVMRFIAYRHLSKTDAEAAAMVAGTTGPDSVPARRFVLVRERFSQRLAARH